MFDQEAKSVQELKKSYIYYCGFRFVVFYDGI